MKVVCKFPILKVEITVQPTHKNWHHTHHPWEDGSPIDYILEYSEILLETKVLT